MILQFGAAAGGAIAGHYVFTTFLEKKAVTAADGTVTTKGFVDVKPGFGLDDIIHGATVAAFTMLALYMTGGLKEKAVPKIG